MKQIVHVIIFFSFFISTNLSAQESEPFKHHQVVFTIGHAGLPAVDEVSGKPN